MKPRFEQFPELTRIPGLAHAFTLRQPGISVSTDRAETVRNLQGSFDGVIQELGVDPSAARYAEQIHGVQIDEVGASQQEIPAQGADGLVTREPGVLLGILVADCCAVYVIDPVHRATGLFHSGKKGSEGHITLLGIERMASRFGSRPQDLIVLLSPCIRPPDYEVDFAAIIRADCERAGVPADQVHDQQISTATDLDRYYSYRTEKGRTGRMLALAGFL